MVQPLLWADAMVEAKPGRKARPQPVCGRCAGVVKPKLRSVMPLDHALETVRGVLIDRLDGALGELTRLALEECSEYVPDFGTAEALAVRLVQAAQAALFPEEFGPGPEYVPDPAGRVMSEQPPPVVLGLVPRHPLTAVYARYLIAGKESPAAKLVGQDGKTVLSEAELIRLGERIEKRNGRSV